MDYRPVCLSICPQLCLALNLLSQEGTRVQAMNTLTQVVNLTQPPFTVNLQGGVQWLVMVCSE